MQLKQACRPPALAAKHTEQLSAAGALGAADRTQSGPERRDRTTAVAILAAAHIGTSGVLADGKHAGRRAAWATPQTGGMGQGVCPPERYKDRSMDALRRHSYSVLIFSSLSRLADMESSTELVPLIHDPPSLRRSSGKGP